MANERYDVAIIGAGPAGALCAIQCAKAGLRTTLIEAEAKTKFGHPCVLEIERGVFARCDVPAPSADEIVFAEKGYRMFGPTGEYAFSVGGDLVYALNLQTLVRRLVGYAEEAGVDVSYGLRAVRPIVEGAVVKGVVLQPRRGKERELLARMVVDATGHGAAITRLLPVECDIDFTDRASDWVVAEARMVAVDRDAAQRAIAAGRIEPDIMYHQIAAHGVYSTISHMLDMKNAQMFALVGIKADYERPEPGRVVDELLEKLDFARETIIKDAGRIRIRRASLKLVCDGFATIGEAAGMVIPLHASGVASGMIAGYALGRHLGKILRGKREATTARLWPWCAAYQRGRGSVLASYDVNRRLMEAMDVHREALPLINSGLMQGEDFKTALAAKPLHISATTVPRRIVGIAKNPLVAAKFFFFMPQVFAAMAHWKLAPPVWNRTAFNVWKTVAERLLP